MVGHGFSLLVEGQKITNLYLGQIQNLLRIPDSQKQRVYHIDEGMKYLKNAFRQSSDSEFYTDALDEFKKSEAIEKKDFFSLFHIGFIHLKSLKHLEPKTSEIYFRNSARYYLAEALIGGTNVSNSLLQSHKGFHLEAAEAYLFAAEACYIQEKFSEAAELAAEAWKTFPDMNKAGLMQAKYLAANKQVLEAVKVLEKAIRINRFLSMEVLPDLDLNSKPEILNLIEKLRVEAVQEAKTKYELCSKFILPNSAATSYLASIDKLIKFETFLEAKEAIDLLLSSKTWTISSGANISSQGQVIAKISSQEFTGSVLEFVKHERLRVLALPKANNLIRIEEIERQKASIQSEIYSFQSRINEQNSVQQQDIVKLVGSAVGTLIGYYMGIVKWDGGLFTGFFMQILFIAAGIATIVFIISNVSIATKISSLKSEINSRENTIERLSNDIKKLH